MLESTQRVSKVLKHFQADHVSRSSEIRRMESENGVGGSPEVQKDLGMVCNNTKSSCQGRSTLICLGAK